MVETIKFKDWQTGEEKEYNPAHSTDHINQTKLICPFDNTPLFRRDYYHNEHDIFCPNCNEFYIQNSQEEINKQAKDIALNNKEKLEKLESTKANLEARIKHAKEVGLLPPNKSYTELIDELNREIISISKEEYQQIRKRVKQDMQEFLRLSNSFED